MTLILHPHHPRSRSIEWAKHVMKDPSVVFLDTETTGLDVNAEIVDIAVIDQQGCILLDTLICPTRSIPAGASGVHGIYDHHVADAPAWKQVHEHLVSILTNRRVVVFNANYDRRIIHQCCIQSQLHHPRCEWDCAMLAYAQFVGEPSAWGKGYRWHKLEQAAAAFDIPPGGHRALADADVCRQVVHRMAMS